MIYLIIALLFLIAVTKMMSTWKLAAELKNEEPNFFVRSYFNALDFIAGVFSLQVFK